jgi:CxxC-x17-CxxC domain-containing protein
MGFNDGGSRGGFRSGGNRGGGFRRSFGGPREMHKIKCSECGKDAEVPFKPRNDSPVYCRECFFKKKGITPRSEAPAAEKSADAVEETEEVEAEEEY